jgi:hypothetical protein
MTSQAVKRSARSVPIGRASVRAVRCCRVAPNRTRRTSRSLRQGGCRREAFRTASAGRLRRVRKSKWSEPKVSALPKATPAEEKRRPPCPSPPDVAKQVRHFLQRCLVTRRHGGLPRSLRQESCRREAFRFASAGRLRRVRIGSGARRTYLPRRRPACRRETKATLPKPTLT